MLSLEIVDAQTYHQILKNYKYFYNSMQFHELNKSKVDEVVYMLFKSSRYKMGIAAGISNGIFKLPYSAPFAMFEVAGADVRLEDIHAAVRLLDEYAEKRNTSSIWFRLPPSFYDDTFISKVQNGLLNNGYLIEMCDLNYQFYLQNIEGFEDRLYRNARKNLKTANKQGFELLHCDTEREKKCAYDVITVNRKAKGYPLRMTYEQVTDTIALTNHDFFVVRLGTVAVAAAIVFQVNEDVYQVIYWGDVPGYSDKRPMNYISTKVYEYYANKGIQVLDIGPSTEEGIPNFGLCDFKESIGCEVSTKYTLRKVFKSNINEV